MVCVAVLLAAATISTEARPLRIAIDGMTMPNTEYRKVVHGLALSQLGDGPAPAPAASPSAAPGPSAPQGLCGCAKASEDQCTCGASLDYLQCVHERCVAGGCECPKTPFEEECSSLSRSCGSELKFQGCGSSTTSCEGHFHQATTGVIGLTLDTSVLSEEAYCGPLGVCTGELRLLANIYRPAPGVWFQCMVPKSQGSSSAAFLPPLGLGAEDFEHCQAEITAAGVGECRLPMVLAS